MVQYFKLERKSKWNKKILNDAVETLDPGQYWKTAYTFLKPVITKKMEVVF